MTTGVCEREKRKEKEKRENVCVCVCEREEKRTRKRNKIPTKKNIPIHDQHVVDYLNQFHMKK